MLNTRVKLRMHLPARYCISNKTNETEKKAVVPVSEVHDIIADFPFHLFACSILKHVSDANDVVGILRILILIFTASTWDRRREDTQRRRRGPFSESDEPSRHNSPQQSRNHSIAFMRRASGKNMFSTRTSFLPDTYISNINTLFFKQPTEDTNKRICGHLSFLQVHFLFTMNHKNQGLHVDSRITSCE